MIRVRGLIGISIRRFCTKGENGGNKLEKTESSVSRYDETYKKLHKLDFVTAAKILFTEPPKKNQFGFDWHVVQFIIVCLPSVAVYLVAQYARRKMKIMDAESFPSFSLSNSYEFLPNAAYIFLPYASLYWTYSQELGEKKRKEEENIEKEEAERKALEEEAATKSHEELMEMKKRLGKIEETIKEIVSETKKPSGNAPTETKEDQSTQLLPKEESKPGESRANVDSPGPH